MPKGDIEASPPTNDDFVVIVEKVSLDPRPRSPTSGIKSYWEEK